MSGHILQSRPNTCVAACVSMVLTHLGRPQTEEGLMRAWGPPDSTGYLLDKLQEIPHIKGIFLDLDQPASLAQLEGYLRQQWVVAMMFSGPLTVFAREHIPPLNSPYGALTTIYDERASLMNYGRESHMVVLIGWPNSRVQFFDPYHLAHHQPLLMTDEWLVRAATGNFWICPESI